MKKIATVALLITLILPTVAGAVSTSANESPSVLDSFMNGGMQGAIYGGGAALVAATLTTLIIKLFKKKK